MASLLRALSAAMRLWRAAVKPASSVGVVGVLLHPAKPKAIVRAVVTRIVREAERLLRAYICPLLCRKTLAFKNHCKPRNCSPMQHVGSKLQQESNGVPWSLMQMRRKNTRKGDAACGAAEAMRGRQPNPRGGHPPSKRKRLVDVWLGMSIVDPKTN